MLLRHRLALGQARFGIPGDRTAVILFTSGSEGVPKGVELTHRNILANLRQLFAAVDVTDTDTLFNCLPMFHSFGLVVGTLLPLCRGIRTTVFPSPLQYRLVPTAVYNSNATMFLSTNTFLNGYARKAHPYDFRNGRYLLAGAEKVQQATADTWARLNAGKTWFEARNGAYIYHNQLDGMWWIDAPSGAGIFKATGPVHAPPAAGYEIIGDHAPVPSSIRIFRG